MRNSSLSMYLYICLILYIHVSTASIPLGKNQPPSTVGVVAETISEAFSSPQGCGFLHVPEQYHTVQVELSVHVNEDDSTKRDLVWYIERPDSNQTNILRNNINFVVRRLNGKSRYREGSLTWVRDSTTGHLISQGSFQELMSKDTDYLVWAKLFSPRGHLFLCRSFHFRAVPKAPSQ